MNEQVLAIVELLQKDQRYHLEAYQFVREGLAYAQKVMKLPAIKEEGSENPQDHHLTGSVDDYQYSESDKQVTLTVSARLLTVETGQVLKNVTLSATSSKGTEKSKEEELNMEAGRQAMDKIMAQLAPVAALPTAVETAKPATPKKKHNNDWLWALLVVGLGLGIGLSSGGGGNGGGIDTPPPPPSH